MDFSVFPKHGNVSYRFLRLILSLRIRQFEKSVQSPQKTQQRIFQTIKHNTEKTEFGKRYSFSLIRTLEEYREKIPIHSYQDLQPWIDRIAKGEQNILTKDTVTGFVETSGTTSSAKLIPVTKIWSKHIQQAQILWILSLIRDYPAIVNGSSLRLVSSATERYSLGGLPIGANTGRMQEALPKWLRGSIVLPPEIALIKNQEIKQYVTLRFALQESFTSWTTANPSTILLYCRKLQAHKEDLEIDLQEGTLKEGPAQDLSVEIAEKLQPYLRKMAAPIDWRPASIWPLAVINCWKGGPADFFVSQLPEALGADIPIREVGITASEGYFGLPLSPQWNGGVLWTLGELLEFRDEKGKLFWAWELEMGKQYELIISTTMGLFRYDLKDVVEVTGFYRNTPIIRFIGKAGKFLNATGEKISEEQVLQAVQKVGQAIIGCTAKIVLQEIPFIEIAIEAEKISSDYAEQLEQALQQVNIEYSTKRKSGRLNRVQVIPLSNGTYQRFRKHRIEEGASEMQVKDMVIASNEEEWNKLLSCS